MNEWIYCKCHFIRHFYKYYPSTNRSYCYYVAGDMSSPNIVEIHGLRKIINEQNLIDAESCQSQIPWMSTLLTITLKLNIHEDLWMTEFARYQLTVWFRAVMEFHWFAFAVFLDEFAIDLSFDDPTFSHSLPVRWYAALLDAIRPSSPRCPVVYQNKQNKRFSQHLRCQWSEGFTCCCCCF